MDGTMLQSNLRGRGGRRWSFDDVAAATITPPKSPTINGSTGKPRRFRSNSVGGTELTLLSLQKKSRNRFKTGWRNPFTKNKHEFMIVVDCKDGQKKIFSGEDEQSAYDLLNFAARTTDMDICIESAKLIVASSSCSLLGGVHSLTQGLEDVSEEGEDEEDELLGSDSRYASLHELIRTEKLYLKNLNSIFNTYAVPLRKFAVITDEDYDKFFSVVEPLLSLSATLCDKLDETLKVWESGTASLAALFPKKLLEQYQEYLDSYCSEIANCLTVRLRFDEDFADFCEVKRQSSRRLPLDKLLQLPIQRIYEYERCLNELIKETVESHPDFEKLTKAAQRVQNMVKDPALSSLQTNQDSHNGNHGNPIDSIQERFPHDDLQLQDNDKSVKLDGLRNRRKSAPGVLLFKTLQKAKSTGNLGSASGGSSRQHDLLQTARLATNANRHHILEGPAQLTTGLQTQERYLFLFNDILLVAKPRSSTTFKLKHRIRVDELWIASCIEDVAEIPRHENRSFVIGWPTTNTVVTFPSTQVKDDWLTKLTNQIEEKNKDQQKTLTLHVTNKELEQMKTITIHNNQDAKDVVKICMEQFQLSESEAKDYRLWVLSGREESAYPLIGHEIPYSIKLSHIRDISKMVRGDENHIPIDYDRILEEAPREQRCEFFLKNNQKSLKKHGLEDGAQKSQKKVKRSPLLNLFKRNQSKDEKSFPSGNFSSQLSLSTNSFQGKLFGQPLSEILVNGALPKPIMDLLTMLFYTGPQTRGILRKSANEKMKKELRQKLDDGEECLNTETPPLIFGALLKDFLRSLPDGLLISDLYEEWIAVSELRDHNDRINTLVDLSTRLPRCHILLWKYILCVLHHIDLQSEENNMTANNLAICIAQTVLRPNSDLPATQLQAEKANTVMECLIENCTVIYGVGLAHMMTNYLDKKGRHDSETDSDSMHSVLSTAESTHSVVSTPDSSHSILSTPDSIHGAVNITDSLHSPICMPDTMNNFLSIAARNGGMRRDDSSLDSLGTDYYGSELDFSPRSASSGLLLDSQEDFAEKVDPSSRSSYPRVSPTNESEDSGVTLSDSPIMTEESEITIRIDRPHSYGRSMSQSERGCTRVTDVGEFSQSFGSSYDYDGRNPVAPPRRGKSSSIDLELSSQGRVQLRKKNGGLSSGNDSAKLLSNTHTPVIKRCSADSLQSVEEVSEHEYEHHIELQKPRDIGTIIKSASGDHLYLDDEEMVSSKRFFDTSETRIRPRERLVRQASVTDTTPPLSPQSPSSHGSKDSLLSDSSATYLREHDNDLTLQSPPPPLSDQLGDRTNVWPFHSRYSPRDHDRKLDSPQSVRGNSVTVQVNIQKPEPVRQEEHHQYPSDCRTLKVIRKQHNVIKIKSAPKHLKVHQVAGAATSRQKSSPPSNEVSVTTTVIRRPEKPPSYEEAIERKHRLSLGMSMDIETVEQKRASAHAKQMYKQSVREFMKSKHGPSPPPAYSSSSSSEDGHEPGEYTYSSSVDDMDGGVFVPLKDPKQVFEESMRKFNEQKTANRDRSNSEDHSQRHSVRDCSSPKERLSPKERVSPTEHSSPKESSSPIERLSLNARLSPTEHSSSQESSSPKDWPAIGSDSDSAKYIDRNPPRIEKTLLTVPSLNIHRTHSVPSEHSTSQGKYSMGKISSVRDSPLVAMRNCYSQPSATSSQSGRYFYSPVRATTTTKRINMRLDRPASVITEISSRLESSSRSSCDANPSSEAPKHSLADRNFPWSVAKLRSKYDSQPNLAIEESEKKEQPHMTTHRIHSVYSHTRSAHLQDDDQEGQWF